MLVNRVTFYPYSLAELRSRTSETYSSLALSLGRGQARQALERIDDAARVVLLSIEVKRLLVRRQGGCELALLGRELTQVETHLREQRLAPESLGYDPHTALENMLGTSDPEEQARRVEDLKQIAILALFLRDSQTDGELGAHIGAIVDAMGKLKWWLGTDPFPRMPK
jgi:hypothetical protein